MQSDWNFLTSCGTILITWLVVDFNNYMVLSLLTFFGLLVFPHKFPWNPNESVVLDFICWMDTRYYHHYHSCDGWLFVARFWLTYFSWWWFHDIFFTGNLLLLSQNGFRWNRCVDKSFGKKHFKNLRPNIFSLLQQYDSNGRIWDIHWAWNLLANRTPEYGASEYGTPEYNSTPEFSWPGWRPRRQVTVLNNSDLTPLNLKRSVTVPTPG